MIKGENFLKFTNKKTLKEIIKLSKLKKFKKGDLIFEDKEIGKNFFIVKSGKVDIVLGYKTKKPKVLSIIEKGDFFGELALLGIKYRTAAAVCATDSEIYVISQKNFKKLLNNKKFLISLLYILANRLKKTDEEIEDLIFNNMFKRVTKYLSEISKNAVSNAINITQKEIAKSLGTSRICVSRVISYLRNRGIIETSKRQIIFKNLEKLKSIGANNAHNR